MAAPALVMLAEGTEHTNDVSTALAIQEMIASMRPSIHSRIAFLGGQEPSLESVVDDLRAEHIVEIALVPLDLTRAVEASEVELAALARVRERFPQLAIDISRPLGPSSALLNALDERLRTALRTAHTAELDALVLAMQSSGDVRGNALVSRRVRQWSTHHRLPCVSSVADGNGISVTQAIAALRAQGRRHIAVGSMFLAESDDFQQMREQALASGAVVVSGVIGPDPRLFDLVIARYSYAAMSLLDVPRGEPEAGLDDLDDDDLDSPLDEADLEGQFAEVGLDLG